MTSIEFQFDEATHIYRDSDGKAHPSVTQILSQAGIFDYSAVSAEVLENARRRGVNVHKCTAEYDLTGDLDPTWLQDDEVPYFEAWLKFRREFHCKIVDIEKALLAPVHGILVGGTPDRIASMGRARYVIDIKCTAAKHDGWRLQTAFYEMMLTGRSSCGHMGRLVVQLFPTGNYSVISHDDASDANIAIAALLLTTWKRNHCLEK